MKTEAVVISRFGDQADVELSDGHLIRCHIRRSLQNLVTGDNCTVESKKDHFVVTRILERKTLLERSVPYEGVKPVAANIDQIIIVNAIVPTFSDRLLDRYLVACARVGATPLILFNKMDLADDETQDLISEILEPYTALGIKSVLTNKQSNEVISQLHPFLQNKTSIFVGQSGVGKSTIINQVLPHANAATAEISETSALGTHTTTVSRLYHIPSGGRLIDSPGIRDLSLSHLSAEDVAKGFVEIHQISAFCKFRNCSHQHEPKCAVKKAVENGEVSSQRYDNYLNILDSLEPERPV